MPNCSLPIDDPSQQSRSVEELIASLEGSAACPIVLVNRHGTIVFVNAGYESATGYHRPESVGRPLITHLHPDDRGALQTWLVGVDRRARTTAAARVRMRSGGWRGYAFEVEWRQAGAELVGVIRLQVPGGGENDVTAAPRGNVHQSILGLEPILRRAAGLSVDVFYRLDAMAVHVALTRFSSDRFWCTW